jgi:hypothetical protein
MPSKGTPRRSFRMSDDAFEQMLETIERRNVWTKEAPWSVSDFIGIAIADKIRKMSRSGKREVPQLEDRLPDMLNGK